MAISLAEIAALPAYTDADMVILFKWAITNNAAGQTRTIDGRSVSFPPLPELLKALAFFEGRVQESTDGGTTALAEFVEP